MSQSSLSAARKRRAPTSTPNNVNPGMPQQQSAPILNARGNIISPPSQQAISQMNANQGLTLPQVISLVDKRLCILETHMRENIEINNLERKITNHQPALSEPADVPNNITEVLDDFNGRFETLAEELDNLKNIVLNLQAYTMDVNKLLLQERVRILGEEQSADFNIKLQGEVSETTQPETISSASG